MDRETFADMLLDGINAYINRLDHPTNTEEYPTPIIQIYKSLDDEIEIDPNPDPEDMPF